MNKKGYFTIVGEEEEEEKGISWEEEWRIVQFSRSIGNAWDSTMLMYIHTYMGCAVVVVIVGIFIYVCWFHQLTNIFVFNTCACMQVYICSLQSVNFCTLLFFNHYLFIYLFIISLYFCIVLLLVWVELSRHALTSSMSYFSDCRSLVVWYRRSAGFVRPQQTQWEDLANGPEISQEDIWALPWGGGWEDSSHVHATSAKVSSSGGVLWRSYIIMG